MVGLTSFLMFWRAPDQSLSDALGGGIVGALFFGLPAWATGWLLWRLVGLFSGESTPEKKGISTGLTMGLVALVFAGAAISGPGPMDSGDSGLDWPDGSSSGGNTEVLLDSWTNDGRRTLEGKLGYNWDESEQNYEHSTRWTMDPQSSDGTTFKWVECEDEEGDGYAPIEVLIATADGERVYWETHQVPCYDGGEPAIDVYVSPSYEVSVEISEDR